LVRGGLTWLRRHQNEDGGWGDTTSSPSNFSTTILSWVALSLDSNVESGGGASLARAEKRLRDWVGDLTPSRLAEHLLEVYGGDRTFSIPILTMCALGGRLGSGRESWRTIPAIPFELAAVPARWFSRLGLPMVSYALPALITMGQVRHHHRPTRNPLARWLRSAVRGRTLDVLQKIQPDGGGFLEAAPLTSFVTMSLVGCGQAKHPVAERAVAFLESTVREDGSWPIDTNLSIWLTSLAVGALAEGSRLEEHLDSELRDKILSWLLDQQQREVHPYTDATPGGWAWTHLSGGVPDADDTPAALLALRKLADAQGVVRGGVIERASAGVEWLLDVQNRDGGIPTFCRGWGRMPFDRSCPDLTAHALRAWGAWREFLSPRLEPRVARGVAAAIAYLLEEQQEEGTWSPLWFGTQREPDLVNPLYGTAKVVLASGSRTGDPSIDRAWRGALERGVEALLRFQNPDGGWGGGAASPSTLEETGLATLALARVQRNGDDGRPIRQAVERGSAWLVRTSDGGRRFDASPIGLYFSQLWYSERLYPKIFTVAALEGSRTLPRSETSR
jgi:squalene-hopene/tetraprenyl-beta-curcumene cyclase